MLSDWVRVVKYPLRIRHRPGDEPWAEMAAAYWAGTLGGLERVPSSNAARVHRRGALYFKRYLLRGARDVLKNILRPSRAARALLRGEELAADGIRVPRPVCLVEDVRFGMVTGCALVTEAVDNAPNLREWLNRQDLGVAGDRAAKRELLAAFAREVARWHTLGWHHADMRIGNVLCRKGDSGWTFTWLDNEGNRWHRTLPDAERVHNLMQVNMERTGVTRTDRMRFWKAYAAAAGLASDAERPIQHAVIDYTRRRWKERGWL